jgi:hypothetical protein
MRDAVIAFTVLAVLMLGGRFLFNRRRPASAPLHVPSADGAFTLMPPRRNGVLLGLTALIPAGVLGLVTFAAWQTGRMGFLPGVVATLLMVAVAAYLFASAVRSRLIVRDTGIERIGVVRHRLIGWTSIAKIAFNPLQHWFFLTMSDGSRLWLPADIAGMGDFATFALRRVRPDVLEKADPVVREVLEELADAARKER